MDKRQFLELALAALFAFAILQALRKTGLGKYAKAGIAGAGGHVVATALIG